MFDCCRWGVRRGVGVVAHLSQVDGQVDFIVLETPGERGALPPPLGAVDGVLGRVVARVTEVTQLALDNIVVLVHHIGGRPPRVGARQFAEEFPVSVPFSTSRRCLDLSGHRQVEIRRC